MRIRSVAFGVVCFGVGLVVACSGKTGDVGDAGGVDGTSGGDGGLSPACPSSTPAAGSACSPVGLECEYGNDLNLDCDTLARCDQTGWTISAPRGATCPTPPPGPACPSSFSAVPQGSTCSTATTCAYPEGSCSCEVYCGPQYPVGHPCEAGTPMTWQCDVAASGCPTPRPRVGSTCSQEGQVCTYGDCNTTPMKCTGGLWQTGFGGCPVSTRRYKQGIRYLSDEDLRALADETLRTRLATYEYKMGDPSPRLGFIVEDDPTSPAVVKGRERVDLYGYTSMAVATLQVQEEEIAELRKQVTELRHELEAVRAAAPTCR